MQLKTDFLGLELPYTNKLQIIRTLAHLSKNDKYSLYFLYSEFFLRVLNNPSFLATLQSSQLLGIDGRGVFWIQWFFSQYINISIRNICKISFFGWFFKVVFILPYLIYVLLSLSYFMFKLRITSFVREGKQSELILGRDFVYDLLNFANTKEWKVMILGATTENEFKLLENLSKKFSNCQFSFWGQSSKSDLMTEANVEEVVDMENIFQVFPVLKESIIKAKEIKPDLILVTLGGKTGKQEVIIQCLKSSEAKFRMAVGVGAALDHLGSGKQQPKPPTAFSDLGLEWLYRFIKLPYRRSRVLKSVLGLYILSILWGLGMERFWVSKQVAQNLS